MSSGLRTPSRELLFFPVPLSPSLECQSFYCRCSLSLFLSLSLSLSLSITVSFCFSASLSLSLFLLAPVCLSLYTPVV